MATLKRVRGGGRPSKNDIGNVYFAPRTSAGSSDHAVYVSRDGRRQINQVSSPQKKKKRTEERPEGDILDDWECQDSWLPGCGEDGLEVDGCKEAISEVVVDDVAVEKAKRYLNSVRSGSYLFWYYESGGKSG